ncbi:hypothetical protein [Clostridium sp.]|uniref:hypothetical protein n=1 Tax=Clostridium sp. TaxID=1506 RepID=UPI0029043327|nr:hypothetical protein [Clostridium sp.]MDU2680151.1 hypothetical protein [Clostridium sp.]
MRERIIYECEHCNKKRLINKTQMRKHEDICWFNSKNKTCLTCEHFEYAPSYCEPHPELDGYPNEHVPEFRYCNLKNKDLPRTPITGCDYWEEKEEI